MISNFITYTENVLLPLGAFGVFIATLIEQIIVPIPSSFVQLGGGFFLVEAESFFTALWKVIILVSIPSAFAIGIGSLLVYYISYVVGKPFVKRFGVFFQVKWQDIENLGEKFNASRKDDWLLLALRSLPVMPTVAVDIFCGIVRYNVVKYIGITFVGSFIRATIFGLVGWSVGDLYVKYAEQIASIEKYLLAGIVISLVVFIIVRTKRPKHL